jgi:hypothetical protein
MQPPGTASACAASSSIWSKSILSALAGDAASSPLANCEKRMRPPRRASSCWRMCSVLTYSAWNSAPANDSGGSGISPASNMMANTASISGSKSPWLRLVNTGPSNEIFSPDISST